MAAEALLDAYAGRTFDVGAPSAEVVLKCLLVAFTATIGHALIFAAAERASASLVAPMTYAQLLVAAVLGWAWFGDPLDAATFGGAAFIIAGGLWLWRAQQAGGLRRGPPYVAAGGGSP